MRLDLSEAGRHKSDMHESKVSSRLALNRRRFVEFFSAAGLGGTLLPGALTALAGESDAVTAEMVQQGLRLAGLEFPPEEVEKIVEGLNRRNSLADSYRAMREIELLNSVPPALVFNPLPEGMTPPRQAATFRPSEVQLKRPASDEDLAFLSLAQLAHLIRTRQITSGELTELYLARLKHYDPLLRCVVTLTEDLARQQAKAADAEIAAGSHRGPLHGIPWGAKDLLAVRGYPTTWGASPFREQQLDVDATVYRKLTEAGAVLVAKLTTGALAIGDRWFGGQTKNPWNPTDPERGSSGSSAGPASATAAGLVGFSIGSETRGSIISPASRCGATGLRPSFGLVSRYGAMTLSWSMDKIGPICRSAEDCALVLRAITGPDGKDRSVLDAPFEWDASRDVSSLRVGYLPEPLEREIQDDPQNTNRVMRLRAAQENNQQALEVIRSLGVDAKPITLPELPVQPLGFILSTEAAAAFDGLTRSGQDLAMRAEPEESVRPERFRLHRTVPAVEYLQANRIRTLLIEQFNQVFQDLDLFIGSQLALTNLTGHPEITLPSGFDSAGEPTSLRLTGRLFGDADIVLLAHAFQQKTSHHLERPSETLNKK